MTELAYSLFLLLGLCVVVAADDPKIRRRLRQILTLGRPGR
jgi:hypothetical protein